jgi:DNA-binding transcriptional MerR regulator
MSSPETLSPSQVARATGISADTLRHYERRGLLPKPARTSAGYRRYTRATVTRVELIQRALAIGFSLQELGQVLAERDRGGAPCRKVLGVVKDRLAALEQRRRDLTILRGELIALVAEWEDQLATTPAGKPAKLLEGLAKSQVVDNERRRRSSARFGSRSIAR